MDSELSLRIWAVVTDGKVACFKVPYEWALKRARSLKDETGSPGTVVTIAAAQRMRERARTGGA